MSRGMVSFLAGMGSGYLKAKDNEHERGRQAKEDAWREEQRGRQRTEWQKADNLDSDLRAAANPVSQGAVVTDDAGSNAFTKDKDAAAMMADMSNAKNTGMEVQRATRVVDQTYTDPAKAGEAAKMATAPEARNARVADTLMKHGQIERAATMENVTLEQKAKRLGLEVAELKFADDQFNRQLGQTFAETPDWTQAAAQVLTKTQVGGLAGVTVQAVPSQDGKTVDFVGQGQDGKQKVLATFDNTDAGKAHFLQRVMRAPVETKVGWIMEDVKEKQAQANADRAFGLQQDQFDLQKRETENNMQYRNRMLAIQQAQEGRARAQHKAVIEDAKIPPAVKMQAATLAKQMESANAALNKAMAEGMFDPANPGTASLLKQQADLGMQYQKLLQPYTPSASTAPDAGLPSKDIFAAKPAQPPAGPVSRAAQKQPVVYDPALKAVVDAMSPKTPPPTGPGTVDHMRRAFSNNSAITGRN